MRESKKLWQRRQRRDFAASHGYSTAANYATGGLRESVLERDNWACVKCGMTADEHLARWGRPITIDHIDKDRTRNVMENLQTLCLPCHGGKDISPAITVSLTEPRKPQIVALRKRGETYQAIADTLGLSIGAIWKACRRWDTT